MKLIEKWWLSYKAVLPKNASQVQISETRQAFYAGAAILFTDLTTSGLDEGDDPTDDDLAKMQGIQDEIDAFGVDLDLSVLGVRRH